MEGTDYVRIGCWRRLDGWVIQYSYRVSHGGESEAWVTSPFVELRIQPRDFPQLLLGISETLFNLVD